MVVSGYENDFRLFRVECDNENCWNIHNWFTEPYFSKVFATTAGAGRDYARTISSPTATVGADQLPCSFKRTCPEMIEIDAAGYTFTCFVSAIPVGGSFS